MNTLEEIFNQYKNIAVLGFSVKHDRASNRIGRYLTMNGFNVFGVNPDVDLSEIDGIHVHDDLKSLPENVDVINIFRRSEFLYDHVKEILKMDPLPKVIWTQIGVIDPDAKKLAEENGIQYIENKCIMVEHNKIFYNT
ncbi:MAG: CoA-binding protein [Ignavibacteria bacterium]